MDTPEALQQFYTTLRELYRFRSLAGLLGWDQQVCLPPAGAAFRAEQQETIGRLTHEMFTAPRFMDLVERLYDGSEQLSPDDQANVREVRREIVRARKLSPDFVAEKTRAASLSFTEWQRARPLNDFAAVVPHLERVVALERRETELVGYEQVPYDALLDVYEPGATLSVVKPLLLRLGDELERLVPLIRANLAEVPEPDGEFAESAQLALGTRIAADIGYDLRQGRIDKAAHPFASPLGPTDVRITTRFNPRNYLSSVFTLLHETGHALYELGFEERWCGTPLGSAVSLGVHESQSRLWENFIGRSRAFARYLHRVLSEFFPAEAARTGPEVLWSQINRVQPSLIRVEADEVTYSLHIIIRMLIEEQLIAGSVMIKELPELWSELYQKYLGLTPADNRNGVMQDIHWFGGSIGYFPTYVLGNLYAAQMLDAARACLPTLDQDVAGGSFKGLLDWLRSNVHRNGMRYHGPELIHRISGSDLSEKAFVGYLRSKFEVKQ